MQFIIHNNNNYNDNDNNNNNNDNNNDDNSNNIILILITMIKPIDINSLSNRDENSDSFSPLKCLNLSLKYQRRK